jgi:U3 small nucleolar RNA-associated protein 22
METLLLPQLTSTLHAFHRKYGAFGTTCRLAKRWIASQLLLGGSSEYSPTLCDPDTRFTEESVELLVASLFLQYAPHLSPPNEAQTGFLRFLALVASTDWKSTALILNFNDKLTKDEVGGIESEFIKRRAQLPLLFIATPEDKLASVWTKHLSKVTLYRTSILAKQALTTLTNELTTLEVSEDDMSSRLRKFYRPDIKLFDAIIWIKNEMISKKTQAVDNPHLKLQFKEYVKTRDELMPVVDFDPVKSYLQELRETFGHLCNFFNDQYGGNFIAIVWKPDSLKPQEFKVSKLLA